MLNNFEMIVTGELQEDKLIVQGEKYKVKGSCNYTGTQQWRVVPATDSNAIISSLQIVGISESGEADSCKFLGRVVEYSKAGRILFKITRPGEKTLRITFIGGSPSIKPRAIIRSFSSPQLSTVANN